MNRIFTILALILITSCIFSQAPEKMSYQAVIRNSSDQLVKNTNVGIQISILQGSISGPAVYVERQFPTTNDNGLVSVEIGLGTVVSGIFSNIDWSNGEYFLKTETDLNGGSIYTITGTSQLLSVPYALYAKTAGNEFSGNYNDLTEKPVFTKWDKDSTDNVTLTGDQTIAGIKSFNGTVTVNTPVNNTDAVNKEYVDILLNRIEALELQVGIKVKDLDDNIYSTVAVGTQVWMAEDLKTTKYNDGLSIPLDHECINTPSYCLYNYQGTFGNSSYTVYNWYTVSTGKLCPNGWHVPTDTEWTTLENYLIANGFNYDGTTTGNKIAKSLASSSGWMTSTIEGAVGNTDYPEKRNATGFTAFPSVTNNDDGGFGPTMIENHWWSSTTWSNEWLTDDKAWYRGLYSGFNFVRRDVIEKCTGYSVRCLKD
jgi:uncharacterized protein (TIGR02145 family)